MAITATALASAAMAASLSIQGDRTITIRLMSDRFLIEGRAFCKARNITASYEFGVPFHVIEEAVDNPLVGAVIEINEMIDRWAARI